MGHWVRGTRVPSPDSCDRIADVLGVDVNVVMILAGHLPPDPELRPDDPTQNIIALVKRVRWMSERVWIIERSLRGYIEFDREQRKGDQG